MDYRDDFISELSRGMLSLGCDTDMVRRISKLALHKLSKYRLDLQSTELALPDTRDEQLLQAFIATMITEGKSRKSTYIYYTVLKRFSLDVGKPLCDVSAFDIRSWLAMLENRLSLVTCENYRSYLCSFYKWMLDEDIIQKSPMSKIKPIKHEDQVKLPFSSVEIDRLRNACDSLRTRAILELLLSSGLRISEAVSLDIKDIDWNSNRILVREGKGNKQRTTFFDDVAKSHLLNYLQSRQDGMPFVFESRNGTRLTDQAIRKEMNKLGTVAGIDNVHPHRCRRTFATNLAKRGMDVQDIKMLMGHTDINVTMRYIHLDSTAVEHSYKKCI